MDTTINTDTTTTKRLGAPSHFTSDQIDQIVVSLKAGNSIAATAKAVGVSESAVTYYKKKNGLTVSRASTGDVAGLEQQLLNKLTKEQEKLVARRAALVESFSAKRDAIDEEMKALKERTRKLRSALGVETQVVPEAAIVA